MGIGVGGIVAILLIREVFGFVNKYRKNGLAPVDPRINWYHEFKELRASQASILGVLQSNQTELIKTLNKLEMVWAKFDCSAVKPRDVMVEVEVNRKMIEEILKGLRDIKSG